MPVVFTFDIETAPPAEYNRIQSLFERLGWENLGGSSYRYPILGTEDQPTEDWFNHVIPALMLFRAYIRAQGRQLKKFTLDTSSSTGFNRETDYGTEPLAGRNIQLYPPNNKAFGAGMLRDWISGVGWPY